MFDTHPRHEVFVVDDDPSVRESLEMLIEAAGWTPRIFSSGVEFLAQPRARVPACLLLDMSMPEMTGLEIQERVRAAGNDTPIIFITGTSDVPATVRAMKSGAVEFLTKPYREQELRQAIAGALERSAAALRSEEKESDLRGRYEALTPRERDVMKLVVGGLLNKQVGGELGISEITVKTHRGNVMRKMHAQSLAALVVMASELGIPTGTRR